jgi:hypothetical protein
MTQVFIRIVGTTTRTRRATRFVGSSLAALVLGAALVVPAGAASYPPHVLEAASCGGGGNYSPDFDYIEPRDPIIYAQDLRRGVAEQQVVGWRVRLNRWTGSQWIVDPDRGGWSNWTYKTVVDLDSPTRYVGGAYSVPSGVRLWVPRLGSFYAVSYQVAWTTGPIEWIGTHLNLINGSVWVSDANLGYFGCRFIKDLGSVPLPSPHI